MFPYRPRYSEEEARRDSKLCGFLCTLLILTVIVCGLVTYLPKVPDALAAKGLARYEVTSQETTACACGQACACGK